MSTGEVPVVKSTLPIRLTLRHTTGEMPRSRRRNYRERYSSAADDTGASGFPVAMGSGADQALGTLKAVCAPILAANTMMHKEEAGWIIIIFDCP
jgi:hypothetical protein